MFYKEKYLMEVLGYIGYGLLIFFAVGWIIGVRLNLSLSVQTISGSLFFLVSAVAIFTFNLNKLHSFWLIPAGFGFTFFVGLASVYMPYLYSIIKVVVCIYGSIVRIGISQERIEQGQKEYFEEMKRVSDEVISRSQKGIK